MAARLRVGVEIGGTFTDLIVVDDRGRLVKAHKVFSTPGAMASGALQALAESGVSLGDVEIVVHGSTVATNTVLERRGAETALIVTEGFRDVLTIQRQSKDRLFDLTYTKPEPLLPRRRIAEVAERVAGDGRVLRPLSEDDARRAVAALLEDGRVESIAVCLLHAYQNPEHELRLSAVIRALAPGVFVTLSSEVLPEFREYERASTTVISAYVKPVVAQYLETLEVRLREAGFAGTLLVMQSNGGVLPIESAREQAVRMVLSGPAGGVTGAATLAAASGFPDAVTLDMGGTSTDVCLVNGGKAAYTAETKIGGLPLRTPMVDIVTVGAGGGSIAWQDGGGFLRVGPRSAGANPGPACYGRGGTEPTVTDAQAVLGLIRSGAFLGGRFVLDRERSWAALGPLAQAVGLTVPALADGIVKIANAHMARAIELVSTAKGKDPRDYALVAFGGAGPLHAAAMAEELGIRRVLVPPHAGVLSAYGLLMADLRRDYVMTRVAPVSVERKDLLHPFVQMIRRGEQDAASYPADGGRFVVECALDMRYEGQGYELTVPIAAELIPDAGAAEIRQCFEDAHRLRYGYAAPEKGIVIMSYRAAASLRGSGMAPELSGGPAGRSGPGEEAPILVGGRELPARFHARGALPGGARVDGPAVIEDLTTTIWVPPGWRAEVNAQQTIVMEPR